MKPDKMRLKLLLVDYRSRDEVRVTVDGVPIPFTWIDGETIEVDAIHERAAVSVVPNKKARP